MIATLLIALAALQEPPTDHPLPQRILRTVDSWICEDDADGASFLTEYKDLIDWISKSGFNGLILEGFIDGRHGGENAARELARYARARSVRLIPGISVASGFVSHLPGHPHSAPAKPCLSRPETREGIRNGLGWLVDSFEVDGVSLEAPDVTVRCGCHECRLRPPTGAYSFGDLALCLPIAADVFRQKRPDGLVTYSAGRPLWWDLPETANRLLKAIPDTCQAQWNLEEQQPVGLTPPPVKHNLALTHIGATGYHLPRPAPPRGAFAQHRGFWPRLRDVRAFCRTVRAHRFDGFVVASAGSFKNPDAELTYLAFIDFSADPELTVEAFLGRHLPRLYGAEAAPEVEKLLAAQEEVHLRALPFWRHYAGTWPEGRSGAATEAARRLGEQLSLARSASEKATADGKRRLDLLTRILEEYRIVCEAAAAGLRKPRELAEYYATAGLPDGIYRYTGWMR